MTAPDGYEAGGKRTAFDGTSAQKLSTVSADVHGRR
jgi:hypothetical protein